MPNRIVAVTAIALALGLSACGKGGQEQAQTPNRDSGQQQSAPSSQSAPPSAAPSQPAPPASTPEQAPTTPPPGGQGSGSQ